LWAREYEQDLTDVLKLQTEVARSIADEIRIQVSPEERSRLASAQPMDPQAHEAYLLGRYHMDKGNESGWRQAIQYFEQAIRSMPDYAGAYAGLSTAWIQIGVFGSRLQEAVPHARAAALKAISLNDQLAEGHSALGTILFYYDWNWTDAEQEFLRALELDPGKADTHFEYGHFLMVLGRHDEAVRQGQIAAKLDPVSPESQTSLGRFLYRARRYEEALPHLKRAVELQPESIGANFRLGDLYVALKQYDQAVATFEQGIRTTRGAFAETTFRTGIARVYALTGKRREAEKMIEDIKGFEILRAAVYAAIGDKDRAFQLLETAVEARDEIVVVIKEDPPLELLHSDPRWKALLRRMNFPA
jgi:tetratricopeptide (TPR) repeat protein